MSKTVAQLDAEVQALKLEVERLTKLVKQLLPRSEMPPFTGILPCAHRHPFDIITVDPPPHPPIDPMSPMWRVDPTPMYVIPPSSLPPLNKG